MELGSTSFIVLDGGDELQIAAIGRQQELPQRGQAIDTLLLRFPVVFWDVRYAYASMQVSTTYATCFSLRTLGSLAITCW